MSRRFFLRLPPKMWIFQKIVSNSEINLREIFQPDPSSIVNVQWTLLIILPQLCHSYCTKCRILSSSSMSKIPFLEKWECFLERKPATSTRVGECLTDSQNLREERGEKDWAVLFVVKFKGEKWSGGDATACRLDSVSVVDPPPLCWPMAGSN